MSVGVDIGSSTIKIVEVAKSGSALKLSASGVVAFQGSSVDKFTIEKDYTSMATILRKLYKETKASSKDVSICIPESLAFTRTIKFPLLTDNEISSAVKWEAEQYIPIPVSEAVVQHTILEKRESTTPPEALVLLVAAPKILIEKYVRVVNLTGMNAVSVETDLMALTRVLAPKTGIAMVIDMGASSSDIAIAKEGNLVFSRSVPIAGNALTRSIAQGLSINESQAEEYKKTYGLGNALEGKIKAVLDPVMIMLVDEIKKAISFYQVEEKNEGPRAVTISGGTAGMPEITTYLSESLGLEVAIANPFANLTLSPQVASQIAPFGPLYSTAVGLAVGGI